MIPITWHQFKGDTPKKGSHVIVEDHEGNRSVGKWNDGFTNAYSIPLGNLIRWAKIRIFTNESGHIVISHENGEEINIKDLYDFGDLHLCT